MDAEGARKSISGQAALLAWANAMIAKSPVNMPAVSNFTSSWRDGRALCALASVLDPALATELRFSTTEERLASIRMAIDTLKQKAGVPVLMDAEDFDVADRNSNMTYVSEIRKRWPVAAGSPEERDTDVTAIAEVDKRSEGQRAGDTEREQDASERQRARDAELKREQDASERQRARDAELKREQDAAERQRARDAEAADIAKQRELKRERDAAERDGKAELAKLEAENARLRARVDDLERSRSRSPAPLVSPRRGNAPMSPLRRVTSDDYPFKSAVVVVVAGLVLTALAHLGFIPVVPIVPFSFEAVRFFTVLAFSLQQSVGMLCLAAGAAVAWLADRQRKTDNGRSLLQYGLYGVSRHPFFVGCGTAIVGLALMFNSMAFLALAATWLAYIHFQIVPDEETRLRESFGEEWDFYASKVPKWLLV